MRKALPSEKESANVLLVKDKLRSVKNKISGTGCSSLERLD